MGNKQSCDEFAKVVPSESAAEAVASTTATIADAWTNPSSHLPAKHEEVTQVAATLGPTIPHLRVDKIVSQETLFAAEPAPDEFLIPESVRKAQTLDEYVAVCSEILPGFLYVSNFRVAQEKSRLRTLGITHVINCCGELKTPHDSGTAISKSATDPEIATLHLSLRDDATEDLTPFLPQVIVFLATLRQQPQSSSRPRAKVLVHCHQGVSRSCALVIAYLMLEQRASYAEASAKVKAQRAISSPNAAFLCQLFEWEKDLHALRSKVDERRGLYRLTPHAPYDPECFVLRQCHGPSATSARLRTSIETVVDEQRYLWSRGTFVYPNPRNRTELIIWYGSKCHILDVEAKATALARQLLCMWSLAQNWETMATAMQLVEIYERTGGHAGSEIDHFGYATELQWTRRAGPMQLQVVAPALIDSERLVAHLFLVGGLGDTWERVTNYDSQDLTPERAVILVSERAQTIVDGFVWIGAHCNDLPEHVVQAAQTQLHKLRPEQKALPVLRVEHQDHESDAFWERFEAGY